jgi:hypothetical protein
VERCWHTCPTDARADAGRGHARSTGSVARRAHADCLPRSRAEAALPPRATRMPAARRWRTWRGIGSRLVAAHHADGHLGSGDRRHAASPDARGRGRGLRGSLDLYEDVASKQITLTSRPPPAHNADRARLRQVLANWSTTP